MRMFNVKRLRTVLSLLSSPYQAAKRRIRVVFKRSEPGHIIAPHPKYPDKWGVKENAKENARWLNIHHVWDMPWNAHLLSSEKVTEYWYKVRKPRDFRPKIKLVKCW